MQRSAIYHPALHVVPVRHEDAFGKSSVVEFFDHVFMVACSLALADRHDEERVESTAGPAREGELHPIDALHGSVVRKRFFKRVAAAAARAEDVLQLLEVCHDLPVRLRVRLLAGEVLGALSGLVLREVRSAVFEEHLASLAMPPAGGEVERHVASRAFGSEELVEGASVGLLRATDGFDQAPVAAFRCDVECVAIGSSRLGQFF